MKKWVLFLSVTAWLFLLGVQAPGATEVSYEYDANGNLISGDGKYYEYNDANRLIRVRIGSSNGTIVAEYFYDHQGQRIKKMENGVVTYYPGKHFETQAVNETVKNTSYYFAGGERVAKKDPSGNMYYYHSDHLGGTNVVTNANGNLVERTRYYPFGEIREGGKEQYTYTGKERDTASSLYYYEARYYSPGTFQFTQADTAQPNYYDPQDLNRYAYVRNNPVKYVDPTGHTWWKPWTWFSQYNKQQKQSKNAPSLFPITITNIVNEGLFYSKDVITSVGKDVLKSGAQGMVWGVKQGYKDLPAIQGAIKGAIKENLGGTRIMGSIGNATGGFIVDKLLDKIEGAKGETVPFLSGPGGIGKLLFRYHKAGLPSEEEQRQYDEWVQQTQGFVPTGIDINSIDEK